MWNMYERNSNSVIITTVVMRIRETLDVTLKCQDARQKIHYSQKPHRHHHAMLR